MSQSTTSITTNPAFVRSSYGLVRIAELAISLCGIICMSSGYSCVQHFGKYSFYEFVVVSSLILLIILFITFFFKLERFCAWLNLPLSLLINDGIYTILYVIAAIVVFASLGCEWNRAARIAAGIFGALGFIGFGSSTYDDYRWFKTGSSPFPLSQSSDTVQPA